MRRFSSAPGVPGEKKYYKNFSPQAVETMAAVEKLSRNAALSSFTYKMGETAGGEVCWGHRAGESIDTAGNILLLDFDNKGINFADLVERFSGLAAFVSPSQNWEPGVEKFHAAVALDTAVPTDKDKFRELHHAVVQWLDVAQFSDPVMAVRVQQLSPSMRSDGPCWVGEGAELRVADVLAAYLPPEQSHAGAGGGVSGVVPVEAVFTVSSTRERLSVAQALVRVAREGKVRVHCLAGLKHDGRDDTAFLSTAGAEVFYHCSGGRCEGSYVLPGEQFTEEEEEPVEPDHPIKTLAEGLARARSMIENNPDHCEAKRAGEREAAVVWVSNHIFKLLGVRMLMGTPHLFNGVFWEPLFTDKNAAHRHARLLLVAVGTPTTITKIDQFAGYFLKIAREKEDVLTVDALNVENGVYVFGKGLVPHNARFGFTYVLPYRFDNTARCPIWESCVSNYMLGDPKLLAALQEALGYLILPRFRLEKLVCFVGTGANGKSTVSKILPLLLGEQNVGNARLHTLTKQTGEGSYERASIAGKLVNITEELDPKTMEAAQLKEVISGSAIAARLPYGDPFTITNFPKQLASTNSTSQLIKEQTHGLFRRLHLIPFDYTIPSDEYDTALIEKLSDELPGILNWFLLGADRVIANKMLATAEPMAVLTDRVLLESSSARQFAESRLDTIEQEDDWTGAELFRAVTNTGEIYAGYRRFCEDQGVYPLGQLKFANELVNLNYTRVNKTVKVDGTARKASGFLVKLLNHTEWREFGETQKRPKLTLV